MILLFLLPFYDRGPERRPERRPIATVTGIVVIGAMAFLTYQGANAGSPTAIELATPKPPSCRPAAARSPNTKPASRSSPSRAAWPATRSATTATRGPGPDLTHIASRLPRQGIARTLVNPTAPMPSFKNLPPQKFEAVVNFLSQLK